MSSRRYFRLFGTLLLSAIIAGCATPRTKRIKVDEALVEVEAQKQREIALESHMEDKERLQRVAFPLLVAAAAAVGKIKVHATLGIVYDNKYTFPHDFQDTAVKILDMGEPLRITQVIPDSPAARAGLEVGDVLGALDGTPVAVGKDAFEDTVKLFDDKLEAGRPIILTVYRDRQKKDINITPVEAFDCPVRLERNDRINAYADGKVAGIYTGMLRFARDDDELALIISHELAHNTEGHIPAQSANIALGTLADIAAFYAAGVNTQGFFRQLGARAYSQDFEAEADYVGLYIMSRSAMNIDDAAHFWRRMAVIHPGRIQRNYMNTHPATPERFVAIEKTIGEIHGKRSAGQALVPEYKRK